jgi:hypothetical protein
MSHVLIRSISRMNRRAALSGLGATAALSFTRLGRAAAQNGASIEATIDVPYGQVDQPGATNSSLTSTSRRRAKQRGQRW